MGGFGQLPWPTISKARGSGMIAGQRGANQGPIRHSSAVQASLQTEATRQARLTKTTRSKGPLSLRLCMCVFHGQTKTLHF